MKNFKLKIIGIILLVLFAAPVWANVEIQRVKVNGVCRAWKYYDSAGNVSRIDLFNDAAVTDYGDPSTVGSFAWALAQLPEYDSGSGQIDGGIIQFNAATTYYSFTTAISTAQMRGKLWIRGQGIRSSALRVESDANITLFSFNPGEKQFWLRFSDMLIYGNEINQNGDGTHHCMVYPDNTNFPSDLLIENVFISDFDGDGIQLAHGWGVILNNVIIEQCKGNGLYVYTNANHIKVTNCKLRENDKHGMWIAKTVGDGSGAIITGSEFSTDDDTGAYYGALVDQQLVNFSGCFFMGGDHADCTPLKINNTYVTVSGCTFDAFLTNTYCIDLAKASMDVSITGNMFKGFLGDSPVNYSGIGSNRGGLNGVGNHNWNENRVRSGALTSLTIPSDEAWGTVYWTTETGSSCTFTLPSAQPGMRVCFHKFTDSDIIIQGAAGDNINGGAVAKKYKNVTAAEAKKAFCELEAINATYWIVRSEKGTWVNDDS